MPDPVIQKFEKRFDDIENLIIKSHGTMHSDMTDKLIQIQDWQKKHEIDDNIVFSKLATREDVKEAIQMADKAQNIIDAVSFGGKWGFRFVLAVAALIGATAVILGGLKSTFAAIISWVR